MRILDWATLAKARRLSHGELEAAGQQGLFGGQMQEVAVKPHARVTTSGKVAAVKQHRAKRRKAASTSSSSWSPPAHRLGVHDPHPPVQLVRPQSGWATGKHGEVGELRWASLGNGWLGFTMHGSVDPELGLRARSAFGLLGMSGRPMRADQAPHALGHKVVVVNGDEAWGKNTAVVPGPHGEGNWNTYGWYSAPSTPVRTAAEVNGLPPWDRKEVISWLKKTAREIHAGDRNPDTDRAWTAKAAYESEGRRVFKVDHRSSAPALKWVYPPLGSLPHEQKRAQAEVLPEPPSGTVAAERDARQAARPAWRAGDGVIVDGLPTHTQVWDVGEFDSTAGDWRVLVMDPATRNKTWTFARTVRAATHASTPTPNVGAGTRFTPRGISKTYKVPSYSPTTQGMRAMDRWLIKVGQEVAAARGDEFAGLVLPQKGERLHTAGRDSLNDYIFIDATMHKGGGMRYAQERTGRMSKAPGPRGRAMLDASVFLAAVGRRLHKALTTDPVEVIDIQGARCEVRYPPTSRGVVVLTLHRDSWPMPYHAIVPSAMMKAKAAEIVDQLDRGLTPKIGIWRRNDTPPARSMRG